MKVSVDILRFAWPYMVASGKACDNNAVRILKAGEEDMRCGVYRSAEVETDGIRRCGDVVFGWRADMPQTSLQHVVLQVVAEAAEHYYDCNGERIPQFVMKVPSELYDAVASLQHGAVQYECGAWIGDMSSLERISLLDRLLVERLHRKCSDVMAVYELSGGDWSQTLYTMLFRAMGGNRNREPYMELARRATYQMVLRERSTMELVEALLLGTSGLLGDCYLDDYVRCLSDDYIYLSRKYNIIPMQSVEWKRGGVRTHNRPLTRIVQLASFVARRDFMFDCVVNCRTRNDVYRLFDVEVSWYWTTHDVPDGTGERCPRCIGSEKADLLAINAVVPVMFAYGQSTGKALLKDAALDLLADIPPENNAIVRSWSGVGVPVKNALDTQALLQLRNEYCVSGRCTDCSVGKSIIKKSGKMFCFR